MSYRKKIQQIIYSLINRNERLEETTICGLKLKLLPGTYRQVADQDDAWWLYLAQNHNLIFDIGANIGYTALLAMLHNPSRPYLLVDPNETALQRAFTNLSSNNMGQRAFYYKGFVGEQDGEEIRFYTVGAGAAGSMYSSHAKTAAATNSSKQVTTITLDSLCDFYQLSPDLVKIDVEGAETKVLEGATKLADKGNCSFFVEMHALEELPMIKGGAKVLDWCEKTNYKAWYLKEEKELRTADSIAERGKCHLVLLPSNQTYPEYLKGIPQNAPLPNVLP